MPAPSLIERLRRARVVQVAVVYLGACWVVLQFVSTVQDMLGLPQWIGPVTIVLLAVGSVVVLATAWVQSLSRTTAAEEAGEVPTDWEIAPTDALESLKAGRIPHLTWGRALLGGVVSLSLAIGAAGMYVLVRGGGSVIVPSPAGAAAAPAGVAVLPFTVSGPGLDDFAEGMVSLVSMNVDGVDGIRSVNPRTVLAEWERDGGAAARSLDDALRVAGATGARYAVVGDAVSTGSTVRLTAELYDLAQGERVGSGRSEGRLEDVLPLIDEMSIDLLRTLLSQAGHQGATGIQRLEGLVTTSIEALGAYLEGESLFRSGESTSALVAFERAVAADSSFALAWSRIASVYGWIDPGSPELGEARRRAMQNIDRLPAREATLIRGYGDASSGVPTPGVREALREHVRRFPDDPEGWAVLGEHLLHVPGVRTEDEVRTAVLTAVDLDPGFAPHYVHALRYLVAFGDWRFFEYMELYRGVVSEERANRYQTQWDFFFGADEKRAAAKAYYDANPASALNTMVEVMLRSDSTAERSLDLVDLAAQGNQGLAIMRGPLLASLGRFPGDAESPETSVVDALMAAFVLGGSAVILNQTFAGVTPAQGAERIARAVDRFRLEGRSVAPEAYDEALEGLSVLPSVSSLLARGDARGAREGLEALGVPGGFNRALMWWPVMYAESLARSGDPRSAIAWYESNLVPWRALARLRLGELYEAEGEVEKARENYAGFLRLHAGADDAVSDIVARGRAGLGRVGG